MIKREVKCHGSTVELPRELVVWNDPAVGGMGSVAVKCIDITQNTDCEGISRRGD